jgi:hypothetical protein
MKAELLLDERHILGEDCFVEIVVWRLPRSARGSAHRYKYRLALVEDGVCTLRYDNEPGKGDHRHIGEREEMYAFTTPEALLDDFWVDVDKRRKT